MVPVIRCDQNDRTKRPGRSTHPELFRPGPCPAPGDTPAQIPRERRQTEDEKEEGGEVTMPVPIEIFSDEFDIDDKDENSPRRYENYLLLLKQIKNNPGTMGIIRDDLMQWVDKGQTVFMHKVVWWSSNGQNQ
jgi:hypothetical protein